MYVINKLKCYWIDFLNYFIDSKLSESWKLVFNTCVFQVQRLRPPSGAEFPTAIPFLRPGLPGPQLIPPPPAPPKPQPIILSAAPKLYRQPKDDDEKKEKESKKKVCLSHYS